MPVITGRFPARTVQAEKLVLNLQYKLDGTAAPAFIAGEGHAASPAPANTHNSTGDFTIYLAGKFVALLGAAARLRFASLGGTFPAATAASFANVVFDSGTDVTGAGSSPGGYAKIHVQTWKYASGIPTLADPETNAHVVNTLELELALSASSVAAQ